MAVTVITSTMAGGVTPVCSECGIALCFDIPEADYKEDKDFWDAWRCESCDPSAPGSFVRYKYPKTITTYMRHT